MADEPVIAVSDLTRRFGARPLKRTIQRMIENPLAVEVLAGHFGEGDHVIVESDRETLRFRKEVAATVAS